ncbi:PaaX family transcriptional regulator C-terminal domain-containing protein [Streptomyces sp. JJ36]|uniref:PaaX family transcriptional regulator n=1 Tax=Streptomyces sp. JJ36 TaxID=2736645 RepID=UPI001F4682FA|nr:PaaX family transcriptional regulator C-terminal domain-containing protein [Streptomyces sp. JJ36]MCF6522695.1 PaaX family transcriptional regulator [Streptomyces sp. JJ36]
MAQLPSPGSLIVTFYGAYGRTHAEGGTVPVAALIRLLGALGVDAPSVRSAVSRLKRRGLLVAERAGSRSAGYAPSAAARQLLEDGDRRIYDRPHPAGDWLLAVFSVPERERQRRHVLRSRLARLGFGNAAPGVWVAPSHLEEETRHVLQRLGLTAYVDLFRGGHAGFEPTAEAVARWWDLPALAERHRAFLAEHEPVLRAWERRRTEPPEPAPVPPEAPPVPPEAAPVPPEAPPVPPEAPPVPPEAAYRDYLLALDAWRRLPYADPGLPPAVLPADWPGERSAQVFAALDALLRAPGAAFVREVLHSAGRPARTPDRRGS